jgi:hypothetical protein
MGFDDLFEDKRSHHGNYRGYGYQDHHGHHDDHDYQRYSHGQYPSHHGYNDHQKWLAILNKIRSNKKLQLLVAVAVVVILIIAVGLIIALLPLIIKIFNYISQNGLQSILDGVTSFLDKLWKGSGK